MKYKIRINLIKFFMRENNLSKKDFCKLCNISIRTLNKLFENDHNFGIQNLVNISDIIHVPMFLLFEEDDGNVDKK